jgi:hypothetical protein
MSRGAMRSGDTTSSGRLSTMATWLFGLLLLAIGVANLVLVHPVPAVGYGVVSLIYLPPASAVLKERFGVSIPVVVKLALAIVVVMFTLGVSDLGDMLD